MNLSAISIKNHVFAWMLMLGLLIFGGICFKRMGISQLPDVDFPMVSISVSLEGASPEVMEIEVVDPIEEGLSTVQGITGIYSTSRTGSASVTVEFSLDKDINVAVQDIQSALGRIQRRLPDEVDPPSVSKTNPEDQPILWLGISSSKLTQEQLMTLVRDQMKDRFSTVEGVGEVMLGGYLDPMLRVWLNKDKLRDYQLTASDVISAIQREHTELPGGRIEEASKEINIRVLGEAPSAKDFGKLNITRRGGGVNYVPLPLSAVATVEEGLEDVRRLSRSNGMPSVGLGIKKQAGSNAVAVAKGVKARMEEIKKQLPPDVDIAVRFDSTHFIQEAIDELNFTLILSALLTALVCWGFLGSWSATVNVIMAIPTSVVGSFILLYALGFTLNTFTLLALSLAIGIVVDDAIMVLENIVRHKEMGKDKLKASLDGSREITFAALAATASIIAIFLPVAFMEGLIGKYFFQFGVTLSGAVAISLLEALTLTPMRCSRFLGSQERTTRVGKAVEGAFRAAAELYRKAIPYVLDYRWLVIAGACLVFVGTAFLGMKLKKEFVPAQDQSRLMVRVTAPVGSSLDLTNERMLQVEKIISSHPEVESYFSNIGGGSSVNSAFVFVSMVQPKKRNITAQELADVLRRELKKVPDVRVVVQDPSLSGFAARRGFPVEFTIRGPQWDKLVELSKQMSEAMEKSGYMTDVDSNYQSGSPELQVIPNRDRARQRGVDVSEIAQSINTMYSGTVAAKFSQNGRRYDVRVGLPSADKRSPETIRTLLVRNNRGELIPLSDLVSLNEKPSLQSISREERQRAISIFSNVAPGKSQAEALNVVQKLGKEIMPPGYYVAVAGSAKSFQESFSSLIFALVLGIVVAYMVLGSQFNSFIHPITVLVALPFSVSGAFAALYLGGQTLNLYSMIGLILLMGIVKKNSILLVEFTNHTLEEKKLGVREALIEACPVRLRPILMTSLATIAGAVPPALAIGPGAESRIPMALAVIGGVTLSTFLTLFVVPCVYSLLAVFSKKKDPSFTS